MNPIRIFKHRVLNMAHSTLLLGLIAAALGYLAFVLGGPSLAMFAGVLVLGFYVFNPVVAPDFVLRLTRARPLSAYQAPELQAMVTQLSRRAGLETVPQLYYLPTHLPNAFATGQGNQAVVAISDGLLRHLSRTEVAGVLAHEISHIKHKDIRVMTFAAMSSQFTRLLSTFGQILLLFNLPLLLFGGQSISWTLILSLIFAPMVVDLLQLGLSRVREFDADLGSAALLGSGEPLIAALHKMEQMQRGGWLGRWFGPSPQDLVPGWLRTHPPTRERIRRLQQLDSRPPLLEPFRQPLR